MERDTIDAAFTAKDLKSHKTEPTWSGARSFFRRKYTKDLTGVDVAVLGVPFDTATTNRPGTRFGPAGIRDASCMVAWGLPYPWGFNPVEKLAVIDYGDVLFDFGQPQSVPAAITEQAKEIVEQGVTLLSLGGDHFVSYPLLEARARGARPAVAGALRRPLRHLDRRRRRGDQPRHDVLQGHARGLGRAGALGADRPAHAQRRARMASTSSTPPTCTATDPTR